MTNLKNTKSQSALEFLMTYGWVLVVVLATIGIIIHFGILNPSNFRSESCKFPNDLICNDFAVQTISGNGSIKITILNSLGNDIKVSSIIAVNNGLFDTNCSWNSTNGILLENDKNYTFVLNKSNGRSGDLCKINPSSQKTDWDLKLSWYSANTDSRFIRPVLGHLVALVESP